VGTIRILDEAVRIPFRHKYSCVLLTAGARELVATEEVRLSNAFFEEQKS